MLRERSHRQSMGGGWAHLSWAVARAGAIVSEEGIGACLRRVMHKVSRLIHGRARLLPFSHEDLDSQYRRWRKRHAVTPAMIETMRKDLDKLAVHPLISLVMVMSDFQPGRVKKAIRSICRQVYPHWNLCIIVDSATQSSVQHILQDLVVTDSRIMLETRAGSSGETGAALPLVSLQAGSFVGLVGQHDELAPEALFVVVRQLNECPWLDLLYSDHDTITAEEEYVDPFFKPGWSPELLLSMNYLSPWCVFRRNVLCDIDGWESCILQNSSYDLLLRFTEKTDKIGRIPQVLYHAFEGTIADAQLDRPDDSHGRQELAAVQEALRRRGECGMATHAGPGRFRIAVESCRPSLVSIIISTRDRWELLDQCLTSIRERTGYARYEIIVLDNGSTDPRTLRYLDAVAETCRVHRCPGPFNFSSMNNVGAALATGEYLLFLNNDVQVLSGNWLQAMVALAQRRGVGAVGAKLLYQDGSIQHAGVVLGLDGVAGHAFRHHRPNTVSYQGLTEIVRNCSAVTAACMLVPRDVFQKVGGFDERVAVEFNDVDLCLRIQQQGYRIVYTPEAELYHHENATRRGRRAPDDEARFRLKWGEFIMKGDPYYNPNLTQLREDWSLKL